MTTNFNTNHQIMTIKAKVNRPKIAEETSSGSTCLFQRTFLTTSVNITAWKKSVFGVILIHIFPHSDRRLKELKAQPQVQLYILKRCWPTKRTGICYLLNEKLFIIEYKGNDLLNQRNELISKCRHKNKSKLMNHKTWSLCGKCLGSDLFSGANFFPHLNWIWRLTE